MIAKITMQTDDVPVKPVKRTNKPTKIVVVNNQKGGVGKTSLSCHLALRAAERGLSVLMIDTDGQGDSGQVLTGNLDIRKEGEGGSGVIFETGRVEMDEVRPTNHENLWLLHGHEALDKYDNDDEVEGRVYDPACRLGLHALPFDVIVIDTPPAVSVRHLAPLAWADLAIIPTEPVLNSVAKCQDVLEAVKAIQSMNPALKWGIVVNKMNRSSSSQRATENWLRETYGRHVLQTFTTRTSVADSLQEVPAVPVWRWGAAKRDLRQQWEQFCDSVFE